MRGRGFIDIRSLDRGKRIFGRDTGESWTSRGRVVLGSSWKGRKDL